ncbi:glycosyltransferase family 2 protein [Lachnospiraceae bacterium SGI.240]
MMKISIVIPVFNVEKYIGECLESVINQTRKPDEVIIVDDSSTDDSAEICKSYIEKADYIKLVTNSERGGVSRARNKGIDLAKGEYVLFVDGDDVLSKYYVEKMLDALDRYETDLVIGRYTLNRKELGLPQCEAPDKMSDAGLLRKKLVRGEGEGYLWNKVFKLEIIRKEQLKFDESLDLFEDLKFVYQYLTCVQKIVEISDILYWYRSRDNSAVHQLNADKRWQQYKVIKYFKSNERNLNDDDKLNEELLFYAWMYLKSSIKLKEDLKRREVLSDIKGLFFKINIIDNIKQTVCLIYSWMK